MPKELNNRVRRTLWSTVSKAAERSRSIKDNKFLASKEIVVLCPWQSETGKFGFKRVHKGRITTVNDLES